MQPDGAATGHALRTVRLLLEAYAGGELPQWDLFTSNVRTIRLEPGAVLFQLDEPHPYVYFVQHGLLKAQVRTDGGRLATVSFPEEGDVLASLTGLGMEGVRRTIARELHPRSAALRAAMEARSLHVVTAIESSLLVRVGFRVIEHLAAQHVAWAKLLATVAVTHATTLQTDARWQRNTPEQRYRTFLETSPALAARLTQRDLANYLNITDVALSRIAKRVRADAGSSAAGSSPLEPSPPEPDTVATPDPVDS